MDIFNDFKVIELASVLAGPSVGQFFAELGAEVVKIENVKSGGDITRSWKVAGEKDDDRSAYFCSVNWGKKSVALDLSSKEGQHIVHQLTRDADVVIASYKPGDAEKLSVDYTTLSALNSKVIYAQITGYGSDNPRVGYDAVIQAEAGFMFMNGEAGGKSLKMPVALIDVLAGHHLKEAILLALLEKVKTGKGKFVEVSLIQAAISSLVNQATNWLVAGQLPIKKGSAHPNIAPYGDLFHSRDNEEILLAVGSDRQFQDLCDVLSLVNLPDDSRFDTNQHRVENRAVLNEILHRTIASFDAAVLMEKFSERKIPAGVVQNMQQVFRMKEAQEILLDADGATGIRSFVGNITDEERKLLPPPRFGEHTEEILSRLKNKNRHGH